MLEKAVKKMQLYKVQEAEIQKAEERMKVNGIKLIMDI